MFKRVLSVASLLATFTLLGAACSQTTAVPATTKSTNTPTMVAPTTTPPTTTVITMTDEVFTPSKITIKQGDTVTFVNQGKQPHWPASAPHPSHTNYPEFDPKTSIASGASWSFTFGKAGGWFFHDHLNTKHFGKVTVTQ